MLTPSHRGSSGINVNITLVTKQSVEQQSILGAAAERSSLHRLEKFFRVKVVAFKKL